MANRLVDRQLVLGGGGGCACSKIVSPDAGAVVVWTDQRGRLCLGHRQVT